MYVQLIHKRKCHLSVALRFTIPIPWHILPTAPRCCPTFISRTGSLFRRAVGGLVGSYGLSWVTPRPADVVWALPLSQCLHYSRLSEGCQPFSENFSRSFSVRPLRESVSQGSPPLWGPVTRHASVAAPRRLVYRPSEPSRPARVVTGSRWNHPLSMVLLYHAFPVLSTPFRNFFQKGRSLGCHRGLWCEWRLTSATPPRVLRGEEIIPPRTSIVPQTGSEVNPFLKKTFLKKFQKKC